MVDIMKREICAFKALCIAEVEYWNSYHGQTFFFYFQNVPMTLSSPHFNKLLKGLIILNQSESGIVAGILLCSELVNQLSGRREEALVCGACSFWGCKYSHHNQVFISQILTTGLKIAETFIRPTGSFSTPVGI